MEQFQKTQINKQNKQMKNDQLDQSLKIESQVKRIKIIQVNLEPNKKTKKSNQEQPEEKEINMESNEITTGSSIGHVTIKKNKKTKKALLDE